MAKLKIGKLPVYKGQYVEGTSYNLHNQVTHDGTTYQSKIDNNTSPINSDNWVIIAKGMNAEDLQKLDSIEYGAQKNTIEAIDTTVGETPDTTIYTKGEVDYLLNNKVNRVDGKDLVSDQKINNYDQHIVNKLNPHDVTKSQVGLGNVTNDAQVKRTEMGTSNGVATLDATGKIPSTQLPSFVDDVLEYSSVNAFPTQGESGKIYIALDNNKTYRWGGSSYVVISETLALGETETTAYSGKKGADLATSVNNHIGDSTHVTSAEKTSWNNKYNKPSGGIPYSDLSSGVQTSLGKADSALQPVSGSSLVPDTKVSSYDAHIVNKSNPHGVTKDQVGLSNVDNTADKDKIVAEANKVTIESVRDTSTYTSRQTFEQTDGAVTIEKIFGNTIVVGDKLINSTLIAKKNTGVNLWDEVGVEGGIDDSTGIPTPTLGSTRWVSVNLIPVVGGLSYYARVPRGRTLFQVYYFDRNKVFIGRSNNFDASNPFVVPSNCAYIRFRTAIDYGTVYNHDICINISDPAINGKYFPYEEKTIPMPTTLDGKPITLHSAVDVRDEIDIKRKKVIRRVGIKVFDGSEQWNLWSKVICISVIGAKMPSWDGAKGNVICGIYQTTDANTCYSGNSNGIALWPSTNQLMIYDSTYTDANAFKSHLADLATAGNPLTVQYELAEPYEEDIIIPATSAEVAGNGMEIVEYNGAVPTITALYTKGQAAKWDAMPDPSDIYTKQKIEHMISDKPSMISTTVTSTPNTNVYTKAEVDALLSELRTLINNK